MFGRLLVVNCAKDDGLLERLTDHNLDRSISDRPFNREESSLQNCNLQQGFFAAQGSVAPGHLSRGGSQPMEALGEKYPDGRAIPSLNVVLLVRSSIMNISSSFHPSMSLRLLNGA